LSSQSRPLQIAAGGIDQPEAAKRQGRGIAELAFAHVDQLEAAAAKIADETVGVVNAGDHANGGKLGLLGAGKHPDRHFDDALCLSDELGTVLGFARRCRGDRLDSGHAHLVDQRAEAAERPERTRHGVGAEPPGGR
jgi:hypothetical protein